MKCEEEIKRFKEAFEKLWSLGINPKHLGREIRELGIRGKLTPEILNAVIEFRRARRSLFSCALR